MPISDWLDMMPSTVTIYAWTGQTVSAVPIYSPTGVAYRAHIEIRNRRIIDANGREIIARGRVYLGSNAIPDVRDKIVLPSEYVPTSPPILAVNVSDDELGNHNTVLDIG